MAPEPRAFRLSVGEPPRLLAARAGVARDPLSRLIGLLTRAELPLDEALVFPHCRSIHTWGMRFPIDIIAFDSQWRIVGVRSRLEPGRILQAFPNGWGIVELAPGALELRPVRIGEPLQLTAQ